MTIYFNWSANALCPVNPKAADIFLEANRSVILKIAQLLLQGINYIPGPIYRGIILKKPVNTVEPHKNLKYLSFSTNRAVAEYFANINGFGSKIIDIPQRLGTHGYIIEYAPKITEVLFHFHLLSFLPYAEAFTLLGIDGQREVTRLMWQKEVMILQPTEPFINISKIKFQA